MPDFISALRGAIHRANRPGAPTAYREQVAQMLLTYGRQRVDGAIREGKPAFQASSLAYAAVAEISPTLSRDLREALAAYATVAEASAQPSKSPVVMTKSPKKKGPNKSAEQTTLGRNINQLRKECGWTFESIAAAVHIDKKTAMSHVNRGVTPHVETLKEYAYAFSEKLGRHITVADLTDEVAG